MLSSLRINYWRLLGTVLVGLYFYSCITNPTLGHFVDAFDLIMHEAGHWLFIFFGEFIQVLGGSLTQILIPLIFCLYFYVIKNDYYSGSVLLFLLGYNFINVSIYMADAQKLALPLLGGDSSMHDWNYLFGKLGILSQTELYSGIINTLGILVIVAGAVMSVRYSVYSISDAESQLGGGY